MSKTEIQNLLVVGVDTVPITCSASEAGYRVYAADYFGDVDLRRACAGCEAIVKQRRGKSCGRMSLELKPEAFLEMAKSLLQKYEIDAILLSSGLDDFSDVLSGLNDLAPIVGNPPEVIQRVREKPRFFRELKRLRIAYPDTATARNLDEAKAAAVEIGYPVVVKPVKSFGGAGVRAAENPQEIRKAFSEASSADGNLIVQKLVEGVHASISFLAAGQAAEALTVNEQLLGLNFVFPAEPFGYCGNIVPLDSADSIFERCKSIAEKIASHFDLRGSNGIDLVISEEGIAYVVEVNPRFQATQECVERVLGINLVKSHVEACLHGSLPTIERRASTFCTRLVLHAPKRIVAPDLTLCEEVRDVPLPGTTIEKEEPLCSIVTEGKTRKQSLRKARKLAESIYRTLRRA